MTEMVQAQQGTNLPRRTKATGGPQGSRLVIFLHALAFVFGFGAIFTLLGSAAGLLGQSLNSYLPYIQRFGAILLVLFALIAMGVFRWLVQTIQQRADLKTNPAAIALVSILEFLNTLFYTERRVTEMHKVNRSWGYVSSALLGVSFSAGWLPCVGPILASIFFLAQDSATAGQGAGLLAIYSLGLGIPFLITGAAFSSVSRFLRRLNRHANIVSIVSGLFLLYVAYLLWTDSLALLTTRFFFLNEWVFALEDWVSSASGTGGDIISLSFVAAAPLALIAGLISFISPCVLPLVPAYIGYLSGAALSGGSK
ncbi:MAG: cytochrome c biogenesis protein CcdA [Caldilineaceae bacterium]